MSEAIKQKEHLAELIKQALEKAVADGQLAINQIPEIHLEVPRDKEHGDFASNIALVLAKPARRSPRDVAALIVDYLGEERFIEKIEVAGPGFINFFLSNQWLYDVLASVEAAGLEYGQSSVGAGERILLEFVSANPVGPMNVVNARAAAIGDTLGRILKAVGYEVAAEYYVNDAGRQATLFGASIEARYRELQGEEVEFPAEGYPADYVRDLAKQLLEEKPDLLSMPEAERLEFCKKWGTDKMVEAQKADLAAFGVTFDRWFRERDLHAAGAPQQILDLFREKGYLYEQDDAIWFASTRFGDDKDRVVVKSDGALTYVTADIAYHYDKLKRGFTKLIDILGPDHHGYIGRMQAAVEALGYPRDTLEVLILQYVSLLRNGQQVKMSKRAGEFVTMQELVDEVGRNAARYFFLMRSPESHLDFDISLAIEQSNENPVFYIQYAHARIASIFRQAQDAGIDIPAISEVNCSLLDKPEEVDLMKKMAEFPEELLSAAAQREPHRMARYALDLAGMFHSYYTHWHVLGEEAEVRDARLALIKCIQVVLKRTLGLLGIDAPERM